MTHLDARYPTPGLAATAAAGAAQRTGEAHTVCAVDGQPDRFIALPSQQYAVLRENGVADELTPLLSCLPNGTVEEYHRPPSPEVPHV